jgi:hypothetical protein
MADAEPFDAISGARGGVGSKRCEVEAEASTSIGLFLSVFASAR